MTALKTRGFQCMVTSPCDAAFVMIEKGNDIFDYIFVDGETNAMVCNCLFVI